MIVFELSCACGCQFEGWFRDRDDFMAQQRKEMLHCPSCGGGEVHKILSPVALRKKGTGDRVAVLSEEEGVAFRAPNPVLKILQAVSEYVTANFDDVGTRLAAESLKIHYGIEEPRNLRGVATEEEEKVLKKEGIELLKIPLLREEDDPS